jgi:hypothetical protein
MKNPFRQGAGFFRAGTRDSGGVRMVRTMKRTIALAALCALCVYHGAAQQPVPRPKEGGADRRPPPFTAVLEPCKSMARCEAGGGRDWRTGVWRDRPWCPAPPLRHSFRPAGEAMRRGDAPSFKSVLIRLSSVALAERLDTRAVPDCASPVPSA